MLISFSKGRRGYWVNRYGKEIKISNMSSTYIHNVLGMIEDAIARAMNMYYDTDFEIPDELEEKISELEEELYKRKKFNK